MCKYTGHTFRQIKTFGVKCFQKIAKPNIYSQTLSKLARFPESADKFANMATLLIQYTTAQYVTISFRSLWCHCYVTTTAQRLTALLVGHKRFLGRFHSRTFKLSTKLATVVINEQNILRAPTKSVAIWVKWLYSQSRYSRTPMHVKDRDSARTEEKASL